MRENEAIVRVYPRHVSERERPMTLMLLPDLPKGVRPLVTPIVDTADAAFVMSLDCQFLAWGSRASGGHLKNSRFWEIAAGDRVGAEVSGRLGRKLGVFDHTLRDGHGSALG
jgi:hypothetical protein